VAIYQCFRRVSSHVGGNRFIETDCHELCNYMASHHRKKWSKFIYLML